MFQKERADSRSGTDAFEGSSGRIAWDIQLEGSETETDAYDWLLANAPAEYVASTGTSYKPQTINVTPSEMGSGILLGEVIYAQVKPLQFTFQTGGGSEKIDYSRARQHWYDATGKDGAGFAPNFKQAINVTKTSIEGVTIKSAQFQFKITKSWGPGTPVDSYGAFADRDDHDTEDEGYLYLSTDGDGVAPPPLAFPILYEMGSGGSGDWSAAAHVSGEIDGQYMADVERMTPSYNNAPFTILIGGIWMHFLTGELLFEGTDGGIMVNERFELTYSFAVSRNIEPDDEDSWRAVGEIVVDEKRGWDLLWVYSEESTDTNTLTRTPRAAYVEKVYRSTNFADLRLNE